MSYSKMIRINPGEKLLFDTNIFIYSALDHPKYGNPCTQLIHEVESGKIEGYIPTIVLNELLHRLMIAEVIERGFALNTGDAIRILKKEVIRYGFHNFERKDQHIGRITDHFT